MFKFKKKEEKSERSKIDQEIRKLNAELMNLKLSPSERHDISYRIENLIMVKNLESEIEKYEEQLKTVNEKEYNELSNTITELKERLRVSKLTPSERDLEEKVKERKRAEDLKNNKKKQLKILNDTMKFIDVTSTNDSYVPKRHFITIENIDIEYIVNNKNRLESKLNQDNIFFIYDFSFEGKNALKITCYNKLYNMNYTCKEAIERNKSEITKLLDEENVIIVKTLEF